MRPRSFATRFWPLLMAWRDSHSSRRRLLLYSASIVLGVAALTAIGSLGDNLRRAIDEQAKSLLGADLVLSDRQAFTPEAEKLFAEIGGEQSRETALSTMIYFVKTGGNRLVQVRAISGDFPFYGKLETAPETALLPFKNGSGLLLEESLMRQFQAAPGDLVRIGTVTNQVAGELKKVPGESASLANIAPRVYLRLEQLDHSGLLRAGSLARYKIYFKFPAGFAADKLIQDLQPQLDKLRLNHETVADRKRDLGRSLENLYHFLNLAGFVALLVGGVGVASAIHLHIKQKLASAAILRCLGASMRQTFAIYLVQAFALGLLGSTVGAVLGVIIQSLLPVVLKDFIPFDFNFHISFTAVAIAIATGTLISLLFALLPLLSIARVSPLAAIRATYESGRRRFDLTRLVLYLALGLGIGLFALWQSHNWKIALGFLGALAAGLLVLSAMAQLLILIIRRLPLEKAAFVWRQGLANLHRPGNRTLISTLSLGLGTFLILTLFLSQRALTTQLITDQGTNQPNTIFFDIQTDQRAPVSALLKTFNLPVLDEAPIVTMRLESIKGRSVESLLGDKTNKIAGWTLRHEYRSSYNDHLRPGEKIVAGKFIPQVSGNAANAVPISLEADLAKELHVALNDEIEFDVQGVRVNTRVESLREVDWRRIQPNFFVLFPKGVLEDAPAMHVMVVKTESPEQTGQVQTAIIREFPNISTIDLRLVLQTVAGILEKVSFVLQFMALFTVLTGLVVVVTGIVSGRYARIQETILLRALGATRAQALTILLVEYAALGILSAVTGIFLALAGAWALNHFLFEIKSELQWWPVALAFIGVPLITTFLGVLLSRGILNQPPLLVLRESH